MTEIQLQSQCFLHTWNYYPETRGCIFHVPNGGSRNKIEGMQLKASGVISGVPDILFLWNGKMHAFEFKTQSGVVSPNQRHIHSVWENQGVKTSVIRSFEHWCCEVSQILSTNDK